MNLIYLDNNATTKPAPEVLEAITESLAVGWANPSSVHRAGQDARRRLDLARESVCRLINCRERDLIFTSGGTESANLAIAGTLAALPKRRTLVTSPIEHSCVREQAESFGLLGFDVIQLPVNIDGLVDLNALADVIVKRGSEVGLVSIMWVNNETGVIQPIDRIGQMCHDAGVRFHVDATQGVGKLPIDLENSSIDLLGFASHKFHGPKGVGALFARRTVPLIRQILGGPQERERRGGTENTHGIIGMGVAADLARDWLEGDGMKTCAAMRDRFERTILTEIGDTSINGGGGAPRIWNTSNIAFERLEAEAILMLLSERGLCTSGGSACSSGSLDPSPVLLAMNLPRERAHGSIRFSLSRDTTDVEIDQALKIIPAVIAKLRASMTPVS